MIRPATSILIAKRRVLAFVAFLLVFSSAAYYVSIHQRQPWSSLLLMTCPALAAMCATVVTRRRFSEIGWRPGPVKYLLAGWLIPIAYASLTYGAAWLTGVGSMPSPLFLQRASLTLNLHDKQPWEVVVYAFAYISVMGLMNIGAFGEELGWRGFLVPELNAWLGFKQAALISGSIWAVWHWPVVIWAGYNVGTPLPYALTCLSGLAVLSGIFFAWLRLKSGSIWPCVLMHAAHNAIIQMFFDRVTIDRGWTRYFTTEFGVGLLIPLAVIAWYCWRRASEVNADARPARTESSYGMTDPCCPSIA